MFVIVGGLVVAVLMAALIAPLFIDWTNYRADFEREATKILGRPVKVAGDASARLLPFPSLSFSNVRVGEDIENPALTIEQFSMDAELAPFLSGEVLIFDMRVTKPRGVVVVDADGKVVWTLSANTPFAPGNVRIENMVVESGRFDIIDEASGVTHSAILPQAQISAKALDGPWRMSGTVDFDGERLRMLVTTGQASEGALPLRISAVSTQRSIVLEGDGSAKVTDGKPSYTGQFTLRPALKTDLEQTAKADAVVGQQTRFKVSGKFALAPSGLALPEFKLETGPQEKPYIANGTGSVAFGARPEFDIELDGTQFSFSQSEDDTPGKGLNDRLSTFKSLVNAVPLPSMPGLVEVNLPAIVAGDTTVRDVSFQAKPEGAGWRISNFKSTLPGRTLLEAEGLLGRGDAYGFQGQLLVACNQPAGLSSWLTGDVAPAIRKLAAIGFSAKVDLKSDVQTFEDLELALGTASFSGRAQRRLDGERPLLSLALTGGALDLEALGALAQGFVGKDGKQQMTGQDVTLSLDAGPVLQNGIEAKTVGVSLRLKEDALDIDRFMITNLGGASISGTGKFGSIGVNYNGNFDLSLVSGDGGEFVSVMAKQFPDIAPLQTLAQRLEATPNLLRDLQTSVIASTAKDNAKHALTISLNAKTSTGELVLAGNFKGADWADFAGSLQGNFKDQDPLAFLVLAGIPIVPLDTPGPAALEFASSGNSATGFATTAEFSAAGTSALFNGRISATNLGLSTEGKVKLNSDDLDPYLSASGLAFSGVGAGTPVTFASGIKSSAGTIELSDIAGVLSGNNFAGALTIESAERPKISGGLKLDQLNVEWLAENLLGSNALDGASAFAVKPVAPFDGRIEFSTPLLNFGALGSAQDGQGAVVLSASTMRLEKVNARSLGGNLMTTFELRNDGGTGSISGDFALTGAKPGAVSFLKPVEGLADIKGSLSGSAKTGEGLRTSLAGSGIALIREGAISGLNPNGFAAISAFGSQRDKAPTLSDVEALIGANVQTGRLPLSADALAWSIAGGKLRMPGPKSTVSSAILNTQINANLRDETATVSGDFTYDAGLESVAGAEPTVPFEVSVGDGQTAMTVDPQPLLQYLTQSVLEREQARVEALQASLVEKQRLRRDVRRISLLYAEKNRRIAQREDAVRAHAAEIGAALAGQWRLEQQRLEEEKARQEQERQAKIAADKAAAEKARADKEAKESGSQPENADTPPADTPNETDQSLDEVFKTLDLDLN